mgnify:CR=1 FL=1
MSEQKERKVRVGIKASPQEFVDTWFQHGGDKGAVAKALGGTSVQTVGNYARRLRKDGVLLPASTRRSARIREALDTAAVAALNARIAELSK